MTETPKDFCIYSVHNMDTERKDNMSNIVRKLRRQSRNDGQANVQAALNQLLWKIVMQNGGTLNVPVKDIEIIPAEAALQATVDSKTNNFVVVAGLRKKKSGLILPAQLGSEN